MSMYGSDENGRNKEYLYSEMRDFLDTHPVSELLDIVKSVVEEKESEE